MREESCRRLWEVEAARDGRLSGSDLRSFEIHAGQCRVCAEERRELDRLANELRASAPRADEIALRRGRERVLADVHRKRVAPPRNLRKLSVLLAATVGGFVAAIAVLWHASRSPAHLVDVVASPGARWERRTSGGAEEVRLKDGVFSLAVHRKPGDPRVVVLVPDGAIDDIGTEFQVTVAGGETRGVVVRQGAVMLKLAGRQPLLLGTPSTWSLPPQELAKENTAPQYPPMEAPAPAVAPPRPVQSKKQSTQRHDVTANQRGVPSSEDLAYLRIVALRREGRSDEARVAAAEYLHSFPDGFRRTEALAFLRAHP